MLMNSRGRPPFWGCMLMNSRGGPPILRGCPPLGTIFMDLAVHVVDIWNFLLCTCYYPIQSLGKFQFRIRASLCVNKCTNEFMNSYIVNSPARHKIYLFELFWHLSISLSQHGRFECVNAWMNGWMNLYIFNGSSC